VSRGSSRANAKSAKDRTSAFKKAVARCIQDICVQELHAWPSYSFCRLIMASHWADADRPPEDGTQAAVELVAAFIFDKEQDALQRSAERQAARR
jgi:hypothetical protein